MQRLMLIASAGLMLASCANVSVGVGVGGGGGSVGVGAGVSVPLTASSSNPTVTMHLIDAKGIGAEIGTLRLSNTRGGLRIEPALHSLPPGKLGFHLHEKADCGPGLKDGAMEAGIAAGSHWDPAQTGKHAGPGGGGHKGDLPVLEVDRNGEAKKAVSILRLSVSDAAGRAFVIHQGGDNFSDKPKPLGGGGKRIACGILGD